MTLEAIQLRFFAIANQLDSQRALPIFPQHDGSAHAEQLGNSYFYVVTDRGTEFQRRETQNPDELLSWFVRDLTSEIAGRWELDHRLPGQDSRRLRFKRHIELLRSVDEFWADQQQAHYNDVLMMCPFNDDLK